MPHSASQFDLQCLDRNIVLFHFRPHFAYLATNEGRRESVHATTEVAPNECLFATPMPSSREEAKHTTIEVALNEGRTESVHTTIEVAPNDCLFAMPLPSSRRPCPAAARDLSIYRLPSYLSVCLSVHRPILNRRMLFLYSVSHYHIYM